MTFCKSSSSEIVPIAEIKVGGSAQPGIYSEAQMIYTMSTKYADDVDVFLKLSEGLSGLAGYHTRAAVLESISAILSEMSIVAAQIFESDDDILKSSSDIIASHVMIPTAKLREAILKMKAENSKTTGLDNVVMGIDHLMDIMNVRTLGVDGTTPYCAADRDSRH